MNIKPTQILKELAPVTGAAAPETDFDTFVYHIGSGTVPGTIKNAKFAINGVVYTLDEMTYDVPTNNHTVYIDDNHEDSQSPEGTPTIHTRPLTTSGSYSTRHQCVLFDVIAGDVVQRFVSPSPKATIRTKNGAPGVDAALFTEHNMVTSGDTAFFGSQLVGDRLSNWAFAQFNFWNFPHIWSVPTSINTDALFYWNVNHGPQLYRDTVTMWGWDKFATGTPYANTPYSMVNPDLEFGYSYFDYDGASYKIPISVKKYIILNNVKTLVLQETITYITTGCDRLEAGGVPEVYSSVLKYRDITIENYRGSTDFSWRCIANRWTTHKSTDGSSVVGAPIDTTPLLLRSQQDSSGSSLYNYASMVGFACAVGYDPDVTTVQRVGSVDSTQVKLINRVLTNHASILSPTVKLLIGPDWTNCSEEILCMGYYQGHVRLLALHFSGTIIMEEGAGNDPDNYYTDVTLSITDKETGRNVMSSTKHRIRSSHGDDYRDYFMIKFVRGSTTIRMDAIDGQYADLVDDGTGWPLPMVLVPFYNSVLIGNVKYNSGGEVMCLDRQNFRYEITTIIDQRTFLDVGTWGHQCGIVPPNLGGDYFDITKYPMFKEETSGLTALSHANVDWTISFYGSDNISGDANLLLRQDIFYQYGTGDGRMYRVELSPHEDSNFWTVNITGAYTTTSKLYKGTKDNADLSGVTLKSIAGAGGLMALVSKGTDNDDHTNIFFGFGNHGTVPDLSTTYPNGKMEYKKCVFNNHTPPPSIYLTSLE